jgi:iron complex outermembrane receptor protein
MKKRKFFRGFVILYLALSLSTGAFAKEAVDELSLADMMNLEISLATKTKTTMQEAPAIVSVITGDEIRNMGARDIVDVLRTVPGLDMTNAIGMPEHQINIRGMRAADQNRTIKLMINDHSLGAMDGTLILLEDIIPIQNIKKIEIIRGPGSALYGTGAFLGVVNIITKEGGDGPSEVSVEGGSYDTIKPSARLSYKKDDFKLSLYGDYYNTNGYSPLIESDLSKNSKIYASSVPGNASTGREYDNFQALASFKDFYFSSYYQTLRSDNSLMARVLTTDQATMNYQYAFGEVGYKPRLGDKGNLNFKFYYDYSSADNKFEVFPKETAKLYGYPEGETIHTEAKGRYSVFGSEITTDYEVYSGVRLVGGALWEKSRMFDPVSFANYNTSGKPLTINGVTYPGFPFQYFPFQNISDIANYLPSDEERTVKALYGQGMIDFKELFSLKKGVNSLSLTAGVRYDNYDDFGDTVNPRMGLVYAPIEKLYFKALYGTAFRAPAFRELYFINNPNTIGNKDLGPEKIATTEGQIGYNFTKNFKGSLTFFNVSGDDLIRKVGTSYQNIGKIESQGVEAELRINFDRLKYAYFNLTWQDVKDTTHSTITSSGKKSYTQEDFNPGSIPQIIANVGMNYDINQYVIANISANYVGERDRSEEKKWSGETLVPVDTRDPVKDRTLANASLTFKNFWKGWEFQLSGYNLFDADQRDPDATGGLYYDMPEQGRSFLGRVSYSF